MNRRTRTLLAVLLTVAVILGVNAVADQIDAYFLKVLLNMGVAITMAVSLNLINGFTGQFSLGHAGFMAIGAYVFASVSMFLGPSIEGLLGGPGGLATNLTIFVGLVLGGSMAALAGLLIGVPTLRLRGDYLAIATLGFGEIIRVIIQNMDIVGGPRGLSVVTAPDSLLAWVFAIAALTMWAVRNLTQSTYGRGFIAVRDDEVAAEAMGIDTVRYKVTAFVVGAAFAGMGGGLFAFNEQYITPSQFGFIKSIDYVVMVILGGMGSVGGSALAAVSLTFLNEALKSFEQYRMILYSLLLIALMMLRPQGLFGNGAWLRKLMARRRGTGTTGSTPTQTPSLQS